MPIAMSPYVGCSQRLFCSIKPCACKLMKRVYDLRVTRRQCYTKDTVPRHMCKHSGVGTGYKNKNDLDRNCNDLKRWQSVRWTPRSRNILPGSPWGWVCKIGVEPLISLPHLLDLSLFRIAATCTRRTNGTSSIGHICYSIANASLTPRCLDRIKITHLHEPIPRANAGLASDTGANRRS